jgi:hypothetical protein
MMAEATKAASEASGIVATLQRAAAATGADFNYLLATAERESGLKPQAQSATSSATGLFQFVDQTWLGLVKDYGSKYGLGSMANAITKDANGHFSVDNSADRQAILALRKDPQVSSLMEGEFCNATRATLEDNLGRGVNSGELYAAHFLGPDAACKLIRMNSSQPAASAASAFPQAADANQSVFFHANGTPKTVREVYDWAQKQETPLSLPSRLQGGAASTATVSRGPVPGAAGLIDSSGVNALMSSVTNWRPARGFFGDETADASTTIGGTQSLLSPGVMDVLTAMANTSVN